MPDDLHDAAPDGSAAPDPATPPAPQQPATPDPEQPTEPIAPPAPFEAPPVAGFGQAVPDASPSPSAPAPPAPSQHHGGGVVTTAVLLSLLLALVVGSFSGLAAGFLGARLAMPGGFDMGPVVKTSKIRVVPSETQDPAVAAAAAAVPSVVNVDISAASRSEGDLPNDHPDVPLTGNGSGVVYRAADDGGTYIITNAHVVEDAEKIAVRVANGPRLDAELVGADAETDIAVIKVDEKLTPIELGDSDKLVVGQTVIAIGSPYGLAHSVTSGIVSAIERSIPDFGFADPDTYPLVDVIQTDAAINPGNSGGALVDAAGRLVGINTAIYSESGSSGGIGFAVPVNTAKRSAEQLIKKGRVDTPFLGIIGQTVTPQIAAEENLTVEEGALVTDLAPGGSAQKSGVKVDDVVIELDGKPIRSMDDLILQVRKTEVGDTVRLTILRDGEKTTVDVKVGVKPKNLELPSKETTITQ